MLPSLFSLLLPFTAADILSDHLTNIVNVSVNPCDDFYLHLCPPSVDISEFPFKKIAKFYKELVEKFGNVSEPGIASIMSDIIKLNKTTNENRPVFDHSIFENLVRSRCANDDACYREEFSYVYEIYKDYATDSESKQRLTYFASKLNKSSSELILNVLPSVVEWFYNSAHFNVSLVVEDRNLFFASLANRVFVIEQLKKMEIFESIPNIDADVEKLKALITDKFRVYHTTSADYPTKFCLLSSFNEKDDLGLSLLAEFEDKINDLKVHFDLDNYYRDLESLKKVKSKYIEKYLQYRNRSTGVEVIDIFFSLCTSIKSTKQTFWFSGPETNPEETMLMRLLDRSFSFGATYFGDLNRIIILAPFLYPALTDNSTFSKNYNLFSIIGHEMFHSVVREKWANRSTAFKNEMECLTDHYRRTCDVFMEESCNSGAQTFAEDRPDVEGLRINYEYFTRNYDEADLKEVVYSSEYLTLTREQAFFYVYGTNFCGKMKNEIIHTNVHSPDHARLNGVMTQMPAFSRAFSCSPDQAMFGTKDQTCNLFGPNSK